MNRLRLVMVVLLCWTLMLPIGHVQTAHAAFTQVADYWSSPVTFRTASGGYAAPIHGALMPDGRILFYGNDGPTPVVGQNADETKDAFIFTPPAITGPFPTEMTVASLTEPVDGNDTIVGQYRIVDSLVCNGGAQTADGSYFSVGGTRAIFDAATGVGLRYTAPSYGALFNGTTWTRVPGEMVGTATTGEPRRWYPTVTRLADGRMLITSGFDQLSPTAAFNLSVEVWDPKTGVYSIVSPYPQTPLEILNGNYTHVEVLPTRVAGADLLMLGSPSVPAFLSLSTNPGSWQMSTSYRPGSEAWNAARIAAGGTYDQSTAPDYGASTVMLPIRVNDGDLGYSNGTVLVTGAVAPQWASAIDRYDPQLNKWLPTIDAGVQREHPNTVDLPDGRVLVIGGSGTDPNVTRAEYVDPMNAYGVSLGSADGVEVRGYHAVTLLLPDGRVMVAGGRDINIGGSTEKPSYRMYYPYYMFAQNRPFIAAAPTQVRVGAQFQTTITGSQPASAELISLGAMTHSFDENQRSVQLAVSQMTQQTNGSWTTTLKAPPSAQVAPPGYYMLFVVDGRRIPSVASIVQLIP